MATMTPSRVDEVLLAAWAEYLEATRGQPHPRYAEVEPWAWNRLRQRLRAIAARERVLKQPAKRPDDDDDGA